MRVGKVFTPESPLRMGIHSMLCNLYFTTSKIDCLKIRFCNRIILGLSEQNRALLFASDFHSRRGIARKFCSGDSFAHDLNRKNIAVC